LVLASRGTSFGDWLKQSRRERDLTQLDLADHIGCSVATIQKIEAGVRRPSRQVAQLIADFFRVPDSDRPAFVQFARGTSGISDRDEPDFDAPLDTAGAGEAVTQPPTRPTPGKAAGNLAAPITSIVGREVEIAQLTERLGRERVRLLTLTGPPGIGKTRLAVEVALGVQDDFADGVFFIPLAAIRDPDLVAPAIAEALGMRDTGVQPTGESLRAYLHDKRMLLVLDNFEQVIDAASTVVGLLQAAAGLKVIVTSRAALNVLGEQQFPISPLPLPDLTSLPDPQTLLSYPSIRLFVERAQACNPAFELTRENAHAVAAICARLDGLPLAIELVAARIKLLPPQALLPRLSHSLSFVKGGPKDLPARQQTLQDAIAWSYDLLDEGEKVLFARLSVFSGGCTLNAIEAVCNAHGDLALDTLEGVQSLSDKSLLVQSLGRDEEPRFSMLSTIHEYASEQLRQSGEAGELRDLHLQYYLAMAEAADQQVQGHQQTIWFARLKSEHENLRAAIERTFERQQWAMAAVLTGNLEFFWRQGYPSEGRCWLEGLLPHADAIPPASMGRVYIALGQFATDQGDLKQADEWLGRAIEIGKSIGNREMEARALDNMAWGAMVRGDFEHGNAYGRQALAIYEELGYKHRIAKTLYILGGTAAYENKLEEASALFSRVVVLARELGQVESLAGGLNALGVTEHFLGMHEAALSHYNECLTLARQVGLPIHIAPVTGNIGKLYRKMGDYEQSRKYLAEGMVLNQTLGLKDNIAETLIDFGELATAEGQHERAARLYGAGERMLQELGMPFPELAANEMQEYIAQTRQATGEQRYQALWTEGSNLPTNVAVDYALSKVNVDE
jgi:predicted ATPase/transcriptional regulator with XRE-family HTH domain